MRNALKLAVAAIGLVAAAGLPGRAGADQIIGLTSGLAGPGNRDDSIRFLEGPQDGAFANPFDAADFAAARAGEAAYIVVPHTSWADPALVAPAANWISTSFAGAVQGSSALFAVDFAITDAVVTSASLSISLAVDNHLDSQFSPILYVNGTSVPLPIPPIPNFTLVSDYADVVLDGLLHSGLNTLYLEMTDVAGPSGLVFNATLTTEGHSLVGSIPEPAALGLFGLGLAGLGFAGRFRAR